MKYFEVFVAIVALVVSTDAQTAALSDVVYHLYTQRNIDTPQVISNGDVTAVKASATYGIGKRNILLIHGWVDNSNAALNTLMRPAILNHNDYNVFVVDWGNIAKESYDIAKSQVPAIGTFVGDFITNLMNQYGITGNDFVLIGHSLGAHVAGVAGARAASRPLNIIGLDPAGLSYSIDNTAEMLDKSDAQYVQIIHTDDNFAGIKVSVGHVDFYPNNGKSQPGCGLDLFGGCSHSRSVEYLAEGTNGINNFIATKCTSWNDYTLGSCSTNSKVPMARLNADSTITGNYYLQTNSASPYAQG